MNDNKAVIVALARLESVSVASVVERTKSMVTFVVGKIEVNVDLVGAINLEKEKARLEKEINHVAPFVQSLKKKLANKEFLKNAPKEVVEGERKKLDEAKEYAK